MTVSSTYAKWASTNVDVESVTLTIETLQEAMELAHCSTSEERALVQVKWEHKRLKAANIKLIKEELGIK